jgi:urea carboxylase system permease
LVTPDAANTPSAPPQAESAARFGYKQELDRSLHSFASFAAGFSYLSILTGMFQVFYVGFGAGGPAFFWTWPLVFAGQLLVALCFAELAAHYPLAGSVYQWSKYTGSWAVGWLTGWVYLASYIISLAAVVLALQTTLPQVAPWTQLDDNPTHNAVFLGCVLIGLTTLVNSVGVGLMAKINNVGVFTELVGASLLVVLLAVHAVRGPEAVLDTQGHGEGRPGGYLGAFLAASLMACFVMYGFDTAGALAEETLAPRRKVPRAILLALGAAAGLGALLLLFALMAAPDLQAPNLSAIDGGLPYIVQETLGDAVGSLFLWDVVFAITVCALAVHTGAVRLIFAMARDNNLPCGRALARVSGASRTPVVPAVVAGVLAVAVLLVNTNSRKLMDAIVAVAILWANLAYLLVTAPLLVRRLRGWPRKGGCGAGGTFSLGRWGLAVNALAVVWSVALIANMAWPRPEAGDPWYETYGAVIFTAVLLGIGGAYYGLVQRHKTGVLPEHRAAVAPQAVSADGQPQPLEKAALP